MDSHAAGRGESVLLEGCDVPSGRSSAAAQPLTTGPAEPLETLEVERSEPWELKLESRVVILYLWGPKGLDSLNKLALQRGATQLETTGSALLLARPTLGGGARDLRQDDTKPTSGVSGASIATTVSPLRLASAASKSQPRLGALCARRLHGCLEP